ATNTVIDGFVSRGEGKITYGRYKPSSTGITFGDYLAKNVVIKNADIYGAALGINSPTYVGTKKGEPLRFHTGSLVEIKDSYVCAKKPIQNNILWTVSAGKWLGSKRLKMSGISFCDNEGFSERDLGLSQHGRNNDYNDNLFARNDIIFEGYEYGTGIHDLYMIPDYQEMGYCDPVLADCDNNITDQFPDIVGAKIFPLYPETKLLDLDGYDGTPVDFSAGNIEIGGTPGDIIDGLPGDTPEDTEEDLSGDAEAPIITSTTNTQEQKVGTRSHILQVTTNENATCKYSDQKNTHFDDMNGEFNSSDAKNHNVQVENLQDGQEYFYYIKCADRFGNMTEQDVENHFSVASQTPVVITPPKRSGGGGGGGGSSYRKRVTQKVIEKAKISAKKDEEIEFNSAGGIDSLSPYYV
ncbi:MAG: hypothetical protein GY828_00600, partial [Candidatus Gracilibacteria bacterium]|nr:hypothetical protein [Candidatus Gracilibacteria bacterium]